MTQALRENETDIQDLRAAAHAARLASEAMADADTATKNRALLAMAEALMDNAPAIIAANGKDVARGEEKKLSRALLDRLGLDEKRLAGVADGVREVAALPDPIGEIDGLRARPNGMMVGRMRIPLGVICMIYEARPGVAADAASLCLKSGNAVLLRGGSDARESNDIIGRILGEAVTSVGLPAEAVTIIRRPEREAMVELLSLEEDIDLVIPRGGEGLIRFVSEHSRIPVLKHYKGVCHLYIDKAADTEMAVSLAVNGKVQRPGVCNSLETILIHRDIAEETLPFVAGALQANGVEIRGCERTRAIVQGAKPATDEDWDAEYLDLIIAVKVVDDMNEAIEHIRRHGSLHTEAIVTDNHTTAKEFLRRVGSSTVLVNASTRFADGNQLGLGAEIGISTTKLHAFGPMGLEGLTTQKFIVLGDGQIRT
ncbi:MAG: glutamate-5-semialdehyde dehydrogenase [Deltaproteobacteria bacterium]|nr:glutamate-5-semialdehyde dehydrogenase [Deltaproteobacteria bacterium]